MFSIGNFFKVSSMRSCPGCDCYTWFHAFSLRKSSISCTSLVVDGGDPGESFLILCVIWSFSSSFCFGHYARSRFPMKFYDLYPALTRISKKNSNLELAPRMIGDYSQYVFEVANYVCAEKFFRYGWSMCVPLQLVIKYAQLCVRQMWLIYTFLYNY